MSVQISFQGQSGSAASGRLSSALSAIFAHADRILRSRSALGPSGNRIEVRECLQLLPLLSSSRAPGGGVIGQGSGGGVLDQGSGGAVFASISIKCGNTVFQVSTGTSKGQCVANGNLDGPSTEAACADGDSVATADCKHGCQSTSGSGSCTISVK
jgi:hypothetical protein